MQKQILPCSRHINSQFCYAYKFGIITNGLGIVRDITLYNKGFLDAHPDIIVEKTSDSPDEDKSLTDAKALVLVLKDFLMIHPLIKPKDFLRDAVFDSIKIYKYLLGEDTSFEKAYIPLNGRLSLTDSDCPLNENGIPCCRSTHRFLCAGKAVNPVRAAESRP